MMEEIGAELVKIPARSPDINPIENLLLGFSPWVNGKIKHSFDYHNESKFIQQRI